MKVEWNGDKVLKSVQDIVNDVAEKGAELIVNDARKILAQKAKHQTGELASQIDIRKSKYKDGGFIVMAQGPGNYTRYRASFVEMGAPNRTGRRKGSTRPLPFMRPAMHKNKRRINQMFKDAMK
jgi:HK97 gp10 family phage protein